MPTYRITDPNTGKTLRITGDSPPTEQELEEIFSSTQSKQQAQQPFQPSESISAEKPGMLKGRNLLQKLLSSSPEEGIAKAQNAYAVSQQTGIPIGEVANKGLTQQEQYTGIQRDAGLPELLQSQMYMYGMPALGAGLLTNPIPTALATGTGVVGQKIGELAKPFERMTSPEASQQTKELGKTGDVLLTGLLAAATGFGGYKSGQALQEPLTKLGGKIVNSLIKPTHREYMFGKNPGRAIAQEGIVALNMDDLANKVDNKITQLYDESKVIRALPENIDKKVDLSNTLKPLEEVYVELIKAPNKHQSEIGALRGVIEDLKMNPLKDINLEQAYYVKGIIKNMQSWKADTTGGKLTNIALRDAYHNVDSSIDAVVPKLKSLNSRMANLISAKTAIEHRIERMQSIDPIGWQKLVDLPFALYKNTLVKTLLGKSLAKPIK